MNPTVVPSVTLPRIEKPTKQSADIINFYSKNKEQVLLAVLVFIFSFCSVAEAITKEDLEKRGVFVSCNNLTANYSATIAGEPKFVGLALKEKAQCAMSENRFDDAKIALNKAFGTFENDLESVYLLLQIKFEESIGTIPPNVKVDMSLYKTLINKVNGDWPKKDFEGDDYYYIQEAATLLTPYLMLVIYDFWKNMANSDDYPKEYQLQILELIKMIDFIGGQKGCVDLLEKVHDKMKQHEIKHKSKRSKPINPKAYEIYSNRVSVVKEEVCLELEQMKFNPYPPPLEDNLDETL